ncbi:MAG: hypothetical protein I3273_06140 [Candidatus Moeniiplasma glomeromycotorum]|nr:hypothetical protein [Candidatus Moeniiplasma glomeromycotorum]MCE8168127.1 hypothetical protein [Candidatus Moeniiplasma glomeromycotorum]MCE8169665.1 hypothetical protein [Candidatus Moeniiplasma glomeromycotorum]
MVWSYLWGFLLITQNLLQGIALYIYLNRQCRQCKKVKRIDRILQKLCFKCSQEEKKGREIKKF